MNIFRRGRQIRILILQCISGAKGCLSLKQDDYNTAEHYISQGTAYLEVAKIFKLLTKYEREAYEQSFEILTLLFTEKRCSEKKIIISSKK